MHSETLSKGKYIPVHLVGVLACICEHNFTELETGGSHIPGLHLLQSLRTALVCEILSLVSSPP